MDETSIESAVIRNETESWFLFVRDFNLGLFRLFCYSLVTL